MGLELATPCHRPAASPALTPSRFRFSLVNTMRPDPEDRSPPPESTARSPPWRARGTAHVLPGLDTDGGPLRSEFVMSKILPGESPAPDLLPLTVHDGSSQPRKWGLWVAGILGGSLVGLYSVAAPFLAPALRKHCLPFVPATPKQIDNVLHMLKGRSGTLVDIGSGDGRIVIAAAKVGFKAVGYELNPWLVWYSRYNAWKGGMHHSAKFYISDLWKVNFSQYSNIVIFGVPQMMPQLEEKLAEELQLDAQVLACRFPFPRWKPSHHVGEGIDTVWVYNSECFSMKGKKTQL